MNVGKSCSERNTPAEKDKQLRGKKLKRFSYFLRDNPVWLWGAFFTILNLTSNECGDVNAGSRWAAVAAMSRQGTFEISEYLEWTMDWARIPDGSYYSNKAPGPMFAAFPFVWVLDRLSASGEIELRSRLKVVLSFVLQGVPFLFLTGLVLRFLRFKGFSSGARHFAAAAMLLGNTAALFMNTMFGHAFAAWLLLAVCCALISKKYYLMGLASGFLFLSDYGTVFLLPAIIAGVLLREWPLSAEFLKRTFQFTIGVLFPAMLWIWYHTVNFGSPLALPFKYQNPVFVEAQQARLWGVLSGMPEPRVMGELLFGPTRGMLFSQPWILLTIGFLCFYGLHLFGTRKTMANNWVSLLSVISIGGLFGLLFMNACFNGWHGGSSPGPRYISMVFPLFGILAAWCFNRGSKAVRLTLTLTLAFSLVLSALVFKTGPLAPERMFLWEHYLDAFKQDTGGHIAIFVSFLVVGVVSLWSVNSRNELRGTG